MVLHEDCLKEYSANDESSKLGDFRRLFRVLNTKIILDIVKLKIETKLAVAL